jgi:hypothetical protein
MKVIYEESTRSKLYHVIKDSEASGKTIREVVLNTKEFNNLYYGMSHDLDYYLLNIYTHQGRRWASYNGVKITEELGV